MSLLAVAHEQALGTRACSGARFEGLYPTLGKIVIHLKILMHGIINKAGGYGVMGTALVSIAFGLTAVLSSWPEIGSVAGSRA